ncbi:hypothetical protein AB0H73_36715 [Streptomyces olivoreticuli]
MTVLNSSTGNRPQGTDSAPANLYSRAQVRTAINDGATMAADEAHVSSYADRFSWAVSAVMTLLNAPSAHWVEVENQHHRETPVDAPDDDAPQYTREQVSQAVNSGIDLAAENTGRAYADDLDNLVVNAALTLLDDPDADFYKVTTECYSESPRVVRSWL